MSAGCARCSVPTRSPRLPGGYRLTLEDDELDLVSLRAAGRAGPGADRRRRARPGGGDVSTRRWRCGEVRRSTIWTVGRPARARWRASRNSGAPSRRSCSPPASTPASSARWLRSPKALVNEEPLRERRWAILALAQYRCARQVDALRSHRSCPPACSASWVSTREPNSSNSKRRSFARTRRSRSSRGGRGERRVPVQRSGSVRRGRHRRVLRARRRDPGLLERLRATPLLVVAGPSGCGKSSLVRAGVVPALRRHGTDVVVFSPGTDPGGCAGRRPLSL